MESDRRVAPLEFARREKVTPADFRARHGASGLVRCGNGIGTAQLTLRADVITTAAHVLIASDGQPRGRGSKCVFVPIMGGEPVAIDVATIKAGSRNPLSEPATRDWAVARLVAPVPGANPYRLGSVKATGVTMCAGGNGKADGLGTERCAVRRVIGAAADGISEVAIDCNAGAGSSGAALVDAQQAAVAIYVGYRSASPEQAQPFSTSHYNFAITIEGPFRRALMALAGAR